MMTNIFLYFSFFLTILILPERIWEKIWTRSNQFYLQLKTNYQTSKFNRSKFSGDKLLEFMPKLEAQLGMGIKTSSIEIPQYKFYTGFLHQLLFIHQKRGISLKAIVPELRGNLIKDLQFERKLKSNVLGGNFQFLGITVTTWGFILFSSSMAEIPLNPIHLFVICSLQILGVIVFNAFLTRIKKYLFNKFDQAIERLYLFVSLIEIGMPVGQILAESKVLEGDLMHNKVFSPCASRLVSLVKRWSENGLSPKIEATEIIKELWHLKEVCFERFLKHLDQLKFTVLAFFFLPAYFFYLYSIFQFFMEQ